MRGQLGVFYKDNKQIGGCFDWDISFKILDGFNNQKQLIDWRATTNKFWFYEHCEEIKAYFFWVVKGKLILAHENILIVENCLNTNFGEIIASELTMIRREDFDVNR